jgi:hypothetical protein
MTRWRPPFVWAASSHLLLPAREQEWRERYCVPRGCHHASQTTWLCIENFLAERYGSTHLESVKYGPAGPRFRHLESLVGHSLQSDEAAPLIDAAYRAFIRKWAPKVLRIGIRL